MSFWRLVISPPARGAWNMAVDEAILEHVQVGSGHSLPTLRLYAWDPACLSLGHAQPFSDVDLSRLKARGWEVSWMGTMHGMERDLVPKHGIPMDSIDFAGLRGKGLKHTVRGMFKMVGGFAACFNIIGRRKPSVVLGKKQSALSNVEPAPCPGHNCR